MFCIVFSCVLLGILSTIDGHYHYHGGRHHGVPGWCPPSSPRIRCFTNACTTSRCPAFPNAVCINDNPCEPYCVGHFYVQRQRRLTYAECNSVSAPEEDRSDGLITYVSAMPSNTELPDNCPGGPRLRCFTNPCHSERCPAVPGARCVNDDPCEPSCIGHFYHNGRQLTRRQCRSGLPYGRGRGHGRGMRWSYDY